MTQRILDEVVVVEGRNDENAVRAACGADTIATHGFGAGAETMALIEKAYKSRGILILTDPDHAGERIRDALSRRFPDAKHAWIPQRAARKDGDVGVENAAAADIRAALETARARTAAPGPETEAVFTENDLCANGLSGGAAAAERRRRLGAALGIGCCNGKTFLRRLRMFGVSRAEFAAALRTIDERPADGPR